MGSEWVGDKLQGMGLLGAPATDAGTSLAELGGGLLQPGGIAKGAGLLATMAAVPKKAPKAAAVFDFANPGGGSRVAKVGKTEVTYGVGKDGTAELILVETPKKARGQGSARAALEQFTKEADANGLRLKLDATPMDKHTTQEGLNSLYESLGFRKEGDRWLRDPT
jgi:GNAT superfamily N-acetyltransferase